MVHGRTKESGEVDKQPRQVRQAVRGGRCGLTNLSRRQKLSLDLARFLLGTAGLLLLLRD